MATNPYVNKVQFGNQTVMDISGDTVEPSDVLLGKSFHDRSGAPQTGSLVTHDIVPTPSANVDESAVVTAVNAGLVEGGTNDDVPSLFGIGKWSNVMSKTYLVKGTANNSPIGVSGIGNWPADLDNPSSADKATWIGIPALYGIGAVGKENIDLKISYDPAKSDTIVLGGWILSDNETMTDSGGNTVNCGKIAVKFGADISTADTHTAVVGIEVIIKRTEVVDVSTL